MLTDKSIMPSGKHKGKKMEDIPADYLLWIYENNACSKEVSFYIHENLDTIKEEIRQKIKK